MMTPPIRSLGALAVLCCFAALFSVAPEVTPAIALEDPPSYLLTVGSYGSGPGQFGLPHGISADAIGHVYVADAGFHRVEEFSYDGTFVRMWGVPGSGPGAFSTPWNVLATRSGYVYVAERDNNRVQKFTADGTFVSILGSGGTGDGQFSQPWGLAEDGIGNIYVGDDTRVQVFTENGAFVTSFGQFGRAHGMAIRDGATLFVSDLNYDRMQYFSTGGSWMGQWAYPLNGYCCNQGIAIDRNHDLLLTLGYGVLKLTATGTLLAQWGGRGTANGKFDTPIGITVDGNGDIWIADALNRRVQKFSGSSTTPVPTSKSSWGKLKVKYR